MIFYRPTDGDTHNAIIRYSPRTCFCMTQLGEPVPEIIKTIKSSIEKIFKSQNINIIDAQSVITGKDFLLKIWNLILKVPLGVAIIYEEMSTQTIANIFYEFGLMQAYGKETLLVTSKNTKIPSDFVRTEHLKFNDNFVDQLNRFLVSFFEVADHYETMANQLEKNPLLAIDYLRRAYLISGKENLKEEAKMIFDKADLTGRAKNSVEMLLIDSFIAS